MSIKQIRALLAVSFFAFFGFTWSAVAVAELGTCTLASSGGGSAAGTGLDGSNCNSGLVCDPGLLVCTATTETACIAGPNGSGCSIGQKCMTAGGSTVFQTPGQAGICAEQSGGSSENNALGDVVCNVYKLATGKVGRGIVVIVLFVTGITFYLGKVNWGTIVAVVLGAGLCFGGPAVVSVLVGKNFLC